MDEIQSPLNNLLCTFQLLLLLNIYFFQFYTLLYQQAPGHFSQNCILQQCSKTQSFQSNFYLLRNFPYLGKTSWSLGKWTKVRSNLEIRIPPYNMPVRKDTPLFLTKAFPRNLTTRKWWTVLHSEISTQPEKVNSSPIYISF